MVSIPTFYRWIDQHNRTIRRLAMPLLMAAIVSVYFIVMNTGGIKYVFSHSMYLPILFSAVVFGAIGGFLAAIIGGLILGPLVPIDTLTNEAQLTLNWVYRMGFFVLTGTTVGLASDGIRTYIKHLHWSIRHDSASYLPNRFALEADIKALSAKAGKHKDKDKHIYCLTMISLANSKEIENCFGMIAVDHILMQMSARIKKKTQNETVVYRTRVDQLCLLMVEDRDYDVKSFCQHLRHYFQEPFRFNTLQLHGDIQIGVVKFDEIQQSPGYYIQKASAATMQAEIANAPFLKELDQSSDSTIVENIELLGSLKEALDSKQLQLYYQPKIDLHSGSITHAEALMRWHHPTLGNIPPDKFIPRAERSTLIDHLTEFAIDEALSQVVLWKKSGISMKVAVNISAQNLNQPNFVSQIMKQLDKHSLDGSSLELELTENSLMNNVTNAIEVLTKLAKLGIVMTIDDFGKGYSSLQYLHKLPVSFIKIDKSFIANLATDDSSRYIVDAAVNLAHKIDMQVVAEGVEDQQSLHILKEMGCDYAQGFLISHPLPAREFTQWYTNVEGIYRHPLPS